MFVLTLLVLASPFAMLHVTDEPSLVSTWKAMSSKSDTMVLEMLVAHVAKNASRLGARVEALVAAPHAAQLALVKKRHREQRNVETLVAKAQAQAQATSGVSSSSSSSSSSSVAARTRGALDATLGATSGFNATRISAAVERLLAAASANVIAQHAEQRNRTAALHASLFAEAEAAAAAAAAAQRAGRKTKALRRKQTRRKRGAAARGVRTS